MPSESDHILPGITISAAEEIDAAILTEIAFAAKRHWKYPERYIEIWRNELTITQEYIRNNHVYISCLDHSATGFYSIAENKNDSCSGEVFIERGFWMQHIFILPDYHGNGIGRRLTEHAKFICRKLGITELKIFVDPHARGFYDKMGAEFLYNSKSTIEGRMIPVYKIKIPKPVS